MSAVEKTANLLRLDLPLGMLVKNEDNPNKMSARAFDLLIDNLERTGLTDPILCRPLDLKAVQKLAKKHPSNSESLITAMMAAGVKFRIVGGHHRYDGAIYLGFEKAPCTVVLDEKFDDDQEKFQLVRMNLIRGKLDPQAFIDLYDKMSKQYSEEVLKDSFGFVDDAEFQKLIKQLAKELPDAESQKKFKEKAKGLTNVDDLAKLLNHMIVTYGDTMPYGYMIADYGGKKSYWLRIDKATFKALEVIGSLCIDKDRTMDDVVGGVLQQIAKGELKATIEEIIENTPPAKLPASLQVAPTKDNLDKVTAL